jgi:hypothetical protein
MSGNWYLNGCDYLMLGFDYELRKHGFAGNSCQIVLDLGAPVSPRAVQDRLQALLERYPILHARQAGLILPEWKVPRHAVAARPVRLHRDEGAVCQRVFNEPLAARNGELLRFDLIERNGVGMRLIFTWAHALMDATAAEHFLALVGREELPLPAPQPQRRPPTRDRFRDRCRQAWRNIHQLDQFCEAAPRSLGCRQPGVPARLQYYVERFSKEETQQVRANGVRHCGVLGDAQYHAAVAVCELHRLHQRLACPSPSYVLPVPVGLRPKGSIEPLISNQVGMLMLQFLPAQLDSIGQAVATMKAQTQAALRAGLLESGLLLSEMFRFLPLPVYTAVLKRGLRGEICSLFYGDTAGVNPLLASFLGAPIQDLAHVAAVTPSPGVGVIFYCFHDLLRVTVLHAATVLTEEEAREFGARLRARLLNP